MSDTPHAAARALADRDLGWLRYLHRKATTPDVTPAWREVYAGILDELIFRHTGWWAAEDWLTGSWWRLANVGPGDRFTEPTVVDVDFPAVALREARWDADPGTRTGTLTVTPVAIGDPGGTTSFRITNVAAPPHWTAEGVLAADVVLRAVGADLLVEVPVRDAPVRLHGPAG